MRKKTKTYHHLTIRSANDCLKLPVANGKIAWEIKMRLRDSRPDLTVDETMVTLHDDVDYILGAVDAFLRKPEVVLP